MSGGHSYSYIRRSSQHIWKDKFPVIFYSLHRLIYSLQVLKSERIMQTLIPVFFKLFIKNTYFFTLINYIVLIFNCKLLYFKSVFQIFKPRHQVGGVTLNLEILDNVSIRYQVLIDSIV